MHTITLTVCEVCEENKETNERKYTCTQLQDLHSRLMLVAGKAQRGNKSVERFTEVLLLLVLFMPQIKEQIIVKPGVRPSVRANVSLWL